MMMGNMNGKIEDHETGGQAGDNRSWVSFNFPLSTSVGIFVQIFMSNAMHDFFLEGRMNGWEGKQIELFMPSFSIFRHERNFTLHSKNDRTLARAYT